MRKKRVINWMVILSILLTGCKQKKDTLQTLLPPLVKAEHIMYEYPDSALHILQEMQMPASSDKIAKGHMGFITNPSQIQKLYRRSGRLHFN